MIRGSHLGGAGPACRQSASGLNSRRNPGGNRQALVAGRPDPPAGNRLLAVNQLALGFFQGQFPCYWGRLYLRHRKRQDLTGDPRFAPRQRPRLLDHLHHHGVTDQETLTAGFATPARSGQLIDRFRARIILPIVDNGEVLGFVGPTPPRPHRHRPHRAEIPNNAETPLF